MKYLSGCILFLLFSLNTFCQKGIEVGANIGLSYYFGDLNTNYNLSRPGPSASVVLRRNFNERVSIATVLTYGQISASDENSFNTFERIRNLDFKSTVYDASFTMEFNFFPYVHGSQDYYYTPYLLGGFSFMKFNPTSELNGVKYDLRDLGTEGQSGGTVYGLVSGAFVYGFGFKMDLNRDWSLNVQLTGRNLNSDYIDDVSQDYPDFVTLESRNGAEAVALSNRATDPDFAFQGLQRGNGKNNDVVYFFNVGIMKYFGTLPCPTITKGYY